MFTVKEILSCIDNVGDSLATEFYANKDGYEFFFEKESEIEDWYIRVRPEGEGHLYDGWWPDSHWEYLSEAVEESLIGSGLLKQEQGDDT